MHVTIAPCPALGRWVSVASRFVFGSCLSGAEETELRQVAFREVTSCLDINGHHAAGSLDARFLP